MNLPIIREDPLFGPFQKFWKAQFAALPAGPVLVAVSGGSDSMALAHLMGASGLAWGIAHCNFSLRGAESDADAVLVKDWAATHNIPRFETVFDTKAACAQWGCGIQEGARRLRYDWLEEIRIANGYAAVATAHHADDSAETVLLNLFRGTGLKGLHGILPVRERVIRPLLFAHKAELTDFVCRQKIPFREDASNATSNYARNALRHEIVPHILKHYPQALSAIAGTAQRVAATEKVYEKPLQKLRSKLVEKRGADLYLPIRLWQKTAGWEALLFEVFSEWGFTAAATVEIAGLFHSQSGRYLDSATHRVVRHRSFLVVTRRQPEETDLIVIEEGTAEVPFAGGKLQLSGKPAGENIVAAESVAQLSLPALSWPLILRRARAGDYFYPLGMGGKKKKVARFLTDLKLPRTEKDRTWVVQTAVEQLLWVVGRRIDERFKMEAGKAVLEIRWVSEKEGLSGL